MREVDALDFELRIVHRRERILAVTVDSNYFFYFVKSCCFELVLTRIKRIDYISGHDSKNKSVLGYG